MNKVVRMYTCDAEILTWQQFFEMKRNVEARCIAGVTDAGDRILARLIYEHQGRAIELMNEELGGLL